MKESSIRKFYFFTELAKKILIGEGGPIAWPAILPDLSNIDFLCGDLNQKVHKFFCNNQKLYKRRNKKHMPQLDRLYLKMSEIFRIYTCLQIL